MPIEPQDVTSVSTPRIGQAARTKADYEADLRARFGRVPSWPELAKRENRAMWKSQGRLSASQHDQKGDRLFDVEDKRLTSLRAALAEKSRATVAKIMAHLNEPKTASDLERETGFSRQTIGSHLREASLRGKVIREMRSRVSIWSLAREAAE
jgi:DNA-binding transcriptional ArsR family regulator